MYMTVSCITLLDPGKKCVNQKKSNFRAIYILMNVTCIRLQKKIQDACLMPVDGNNFPTVSRNIKSLSIKCNKVCPQKNPSALQKWFLLTTCGLLGMCVLHLYIQYVCMYVHTNVYMYQSIKFCDCPSYTKQGDYFKMLHMMQPGRRHPLSRGIPRPIERTMF